MNRGGATTVVMAKARAARIERTRDKFRPLLAVAVSLVKGGATIKDACEKAGVRQAVYYTWRKRGMLPKAARALKNHQRPGAGGAFFTLLCRRCGREIATMAKGKGPPPKALCPECLQIAVQGSVIKAIRAAMKGEA